MKNKEEILETRTKSRSESCLRRTEQWIAPALCENMTPDRIKVMSYIHAQTDTDRLTDKDR